MRKYRDVKLDTGMEEEIDAFEEEEAVEETVEFADGFSDEFVSEETVEETTVEEEAIASENEEL